MRALNHSDSLYRFAAALLLAGMLFLGVGQSASAACCSSVPQQASSECCGGSPESSPSPCSEAHFCCGKEIVAFEPFRAYVTSKALILVSTGDSEDYSALVTLKAPAFLSAHTGKPRLLLSFAELVLQESLLSHAPPVGAV
jgi:hypothetical protein